MNYSELAEQSVFSAIEIERPIEPSPISNMQVLNDSLVKTSAPSANLSKINPDAYRIVNLPPTIRTLPTNSIYDYILYIDPASPDFRFVPVANDTTSKAGASRLISESLKPFMNESRPNANALKSMFTKVQTEAAVAQTVSDTRSTRAR